MAVLWLDQFTLDPADTGELLARHAALVAAVKDAPLLPRLRRDEDRTA